MSTIKVHNTLHLWHGQKRLLQVIIAVHGDAHEDYWNFDLFGQKNLPAQIRYTHALHDYTPNNKCAGWIAPKAVDIESDDIRLSVSYWY